MKSAAQPNRGFTLVELMVVVSIIAILSAIGLTIFSQAQKSGRDAKRQADIHEIQTALEQYYALNRTYPMAGTSTTTLSNAIGPSFASGAVPSGPKSGESYNYKPCGTADQYTLCTNTGTMETCATGTDRNCNASAVGDGCSAYSTGTPNTLFCVRSLSN